jgi:hypothetical protein
MLYVFFQISRISKLKLFFDGWVLMSDLHAKLAKQKQLDWLFVNATRLFAFIVLLLISPTLQAIVCPGIMAKKLNS